MWGMKIIRHRIILLTALAVLLTVSLPSPAMARETHVTVTFAAGGVACGIYFMFYFTTGNFADYQGYLSKDQAIMNYTDEGGWHFGCPQLKFIQDTRSHGTPCVEIIRYEF